MARPTFDASLMGTFAALALALTSVGIYGLLSFQVARRTQEIGIRMEAEKIAIGMTQQQVRMSWGEPKSILHTITGATNSDQWVFGGNAYVYFADGLVSGIQNEK